MNKNEQSTGKKSSEGSLTKSRSTSSTPKGEGKSTGGAKGSNTKSGNQGDSLSRSR